jgi:hypothetical protein
MSHHLSGRKLRYLIAAGVVAAIVVGVWFYTRSGRYRPLPSSFDGNSEQLLQTVIVPTLDSPLPEGKSAVWCVSFQLAWNRLKDDVAKEPVQITNAQPIADRLNRADQSENDVDPASVFAAAGFETDGIVERIRSEMAAKFPNAPRPELDVPPQGVVAYAFLAASAKYDYPFFENDEPFLFRDSSGKETPVSSFGIRKRDDYAYDQLRHQVRILYSSGVEPLGEQEVPEFILDPCETSQPYQVVLARVDRKTTLAETVADIQQKIAAHARDRRNSFLTPRDTVLVPNMAWKVSHRFRELEGRDKPFLNPALRGMHLETAMQTNHFRLDRSGAELASESKVYVKPSAVFYHVNRPFLVYLKKRGGQHPFFVAWVENAELLDKK